MTTPMTFEEHLDTLCETVTLQLWFVRRWLRDHPDETIYHAVRRRTDIYRKTDLYDGRPMSEIDYDAPPWPELERRLADLHERTRDDEDSTRFESEGLAILRGRIEAKARNDQRERFRSVPGSSQCGSLRYDPPKPECPTRVPFHIGNAVRPKSIFDDPAYLPECLRCVMDKAEAEFGADSLATSTWLNSYPPWLALFPPEWHENMGPEMTDIRWGMGFWGQFINARGAFNHKHAAMFRATGRMPYWPRTSWCTFAALRKHLADGEQHEGGMATPTGSP